MPFYAGDRDTTLDDVEVLGAWNFTLQGDTPLHWIKTGILDRYLLRFRVHSQCPSTCGIVIHAEADQAGTDGVSFWIERRLPKEPDGKETRRYILSGSGLDSRSIITRPFSDDGGSFSEEVEVLVQGYTGAVFLQNRKVTLKFRMKMARGCLAFYNSSSAKGGQDDVHFSDVRMTALRRGPLELQGTLGRRERALEELDRPRPEPERPAAEAEEEPATQSTEEVAATASEGVDATTALATTEVKKGHAHDSLATVSTFAPSASETWGGTVPSASETWAPSLSGSLRKTSDARSPASPQSLGAATTQRYGQLNRMGSVTPGRRGEGGRSSPSSPPFIKRSTSESSMRRSGSSAKMWGLRPAAPRQRLVATQVNAPDKEFKLLQPTLKPRPEAPRQCADFIRLEN